MLKSMTVLDQIQISHDFFYLLERDLDQPEEQTRTNEQKVVFRLHSYW